jgi:predicted NBD/HSP70 family sugar kinase
MRKRITDQYKTAAQLVLNVRSGRAASRRDLATLMELSPSTVGLYVDQMIRSGFLKESGREQGAMGRPKRRLVTDGSAGWFAGVEFHAGRVRGVRVDFSGQFIRAHELELRPGDGPEEVVSVINDLVSELRGGSAGVLIGVGVGAPGVVNPETGVVGQYAFLKNWSGVPLGPLLANRLGVVVEMDGNLRAIARGERWFGGGLETSNYLVLGPRVGFGVAVVQAGELYGGARNAAGEIGNWQWTLEGETVELHEALAAPAVWRRLAGVGREVVEPKQLTVALGELTRAGREEAWAAVRADFAKVIGYLELLLDCGTYFVHGPLTALGEAFWDEVEEAVVEVMPHLLGRRPCIRCSRLGEDAGPLGAASLAMEKWVPWW